MDTFFYLDAQNKQQGPVSTSRFAENGITAQTLVWRDGMENWTPAGQVPELQHLFTGNATPESPNATECFQETRQQSAPETNSYNPQGNGNQTQTGYNQMQGNYNQPQGGGFNQPQGNYNQTQTGFNPYAQGNPHMLGPRPSNYLILSIFTTICCCLPFGIVGIIYSNKVDTAFYAGDYLSAVNYSNQARTWNIIGIVSGSLISLIYLATQGLWFGSMLFI